MTSEAGHLKKIAALETLLAQAQATSSTPTVHFSGIPSAVRMRVHANETFALDPHQYMLTWPLGVSGFQASEQVAH